MTELLSKLISFLKTDSAKFIGRYKDFIVKVLILSVAAMVLMWVAEIGMFKLPEPFKLPEY